MTTYEYQVTKSGSGDYDVCRIEHYSYGSYSSSLPSALTLWGAKRVIRADRRRRQRYEAEHGQLVYKECGP